MPTTNAGWLTLHEVLEETGLPYGRLKDLVERGELTTRASGAAELYDPEDVALLRAAASPG